MHHYGIAFPRIFEQRLELRPFGVLAGCLAGENPIRVEMFKLTFGVLIVTADPNVSDALPLACHKPPLLSGKV